VRKPELNDFGLTEEMVDAAQAEEAIAARKREEEQIAAKRRRNRGWIVFGVVSAAATVWCGVIWGKQTAGLLVLYAFLLVLYITMADELIGVSGWLKRRRARKRLAMMQQNPVLAAKAAYDVAMTEYRAEEQRKLRSFWETLDGLDFEHELAAVLSKADYSVEVTRGSGDDGVDIWAQKDEETIAIQCKRYGGAVGPAVIRELYGVLMHLDADRGIVATTGYFTQGAIDFAQDKPIDLWTLDDILKLQRDKNTTAG
jgi:HJR/Mrr/RecB family endonuclease